MKQTHLADVGEDNERRDEDDGLLVDDVELGGDGGGGSADTEEGGAGLGDEAGRRGQLLDDLGRALLGGGRVGGHHPTL